MKYILTKKEYKSLKQKAKQSQQQTSFVLQDLCTKVADHMPILYWNQTVAEPWGCILSTDGEAYCDECPVQEVCPNQHKEYSK